MREEEFDAGAQEPVFVGLTVADCKAYVWEEVLAAVSAFTYPWLTVHCVFQEDSERAHSAWTTWREDQRFPTSGRLVRGRAGPYHERHTQESVTRITATYAALRNDFLSTGLPWCLLIECDILPPPDLLERLPPAELVMAAHVARTIPEYMACGFWIRSGPQWRMKKVYEFPAHGISPVGMVFLGCTLASRRCIEAAGWGDPNESYAVYRGPDADLCANALKAHGVSPVVDLDNRAVHVNLKDGALLYHGLEEANTGRLCLATSSVPCER
ncbi:MAG: hypothetical protein BWY10_02560 [Chloroflexi bacterium ADurb.Bin180]|nr:MAG: hypothetical protein BWY10_02560 [Chloroflexi bacterium ADurb.Bin180]